MIKLANPSNSIESNPSNSSLNQIAFAASTPDSLPSALFYHESIIQSLRSKFPLNANSQLKLPFTVLISDPLSLFISFPDPQRASHRSHLFHIHRIEIFTNHFLYNEIYNWVVRVVSVFASTRRHPASNSSFHHLSLAKQTYTRSLHLSHPSKVGRYPQTWEESLPLYMLKHDRIQCGCSKQALSLPPLLPSNREAGNWFLYLVFFDCFPTKQSENEDENRMRCPVPLIWINCSRERCTDLQIRLPLQIDS